MRAAFFAAGVIGLAVGALAITACRNILGADEEDYTDVVVDFCSCTDEIDVFDSQEECTSVVMKRLEQTEGDYLSAWLAKYVKDCSGSCEVAKDCYYAVPVCSVAACSKDEECCSYDGGADACNEKGECAPLAP